MDCRIVEWTFPRFAKLLPAKASWSIWVSRWDFALSWNCTDTLMQQSGNRDWALLGRFDSFVEDEREQAISWTDWLQCIFVSSFPSSSTSLTQFVGVYWDVVRRNNWWGCERESQRLFEGQYFIESIEYGMDAFRKQHWVTGSPIIFPQHMEIEQCSLLATLPQNLHHLKFTVFFSFWISSLSLGHSFPNRIIFLTRLQGRWRFVHCWQTMQSLLQQISRL